MAAALSCALTVSMLACGDAGKRTVVIKPPEEVDASTSAMVLPDGSLLEDSAPPERCIVNNEYLAEHKRCSVDADCALFSHQVTCCPDADSTLVAVSGDELDQVEACADRSKVVCACQAGLTRTEDGRVVSDSGPAIARCVDQQCFSAVGQRSCGSRSTCGAHEICVTYENVPGGIPPDPDSPDNKLLTFRCVPNPCQGKLDCECVQPVCDARNDAERKCEIKRNAESDVTCIAFHD